MDVLQLLNTIFVGCTVVIAIVAVAAAYRVGLRQIEINNRLLKLQDFVAVSVAPNKDTIALWNTGNSNLYMWGFDMPNNNQRFDKPRLISKSTVANYWIPSPNFGKISTTTYFDFKLYLTDEYGNKWISENGGKAIPTKIIKDEREEDIVIIKIWSYKTKRIDWKL